LGFFLVLGWGGSWVLRWRDSDLFIDHFLEAKVSFLVQLIWAYSRALVQEHHIRNNGPYKKSIHVEDRSLRLRREFPMTDCNTDYIGHADDID
jgi:hypothetical protein